MDRLHPRNIFRKQGNLAVREFHGVAQAVMMSRFLYKTFKAPSTLLHTSLLHCRRNRIMMVPGTMNGNLDPDIVGSGGMDDRFGPGAMGSGMMGGNSGRGMMGR
jgi:hypothetical protein